MFNNIFLKTLRDKQKTFLWWTIGILFLSIWYNIMYKTIEGVGLSGMNKMMESEFMQGFLGGVYDLSTPEGWLSTELLPLLGPIIFIVFGVSFASSEITGEEKEGTLNLLLSGPISRSRFFLQKFFAMTVDISGLGGVFWISNIIGTSAAGMKLSYLSLAEVSFSLVFLGLTFGSLVLALGGLTSKRGIGIGSASTIAVVSYLLNSMSQIVEELKPLRPASVFHYYDGAEVLKNGINFADIGILLGGILVLLTIGLYGFQYRDIGT